MTIRKTVAITLLGMGLALFAPSGGLRAQEGEPGGAQARQPAGLRPANTPYLVGAYLVVWGALWAYMASIHRGQRKLEKRLDQIETREP